MEELLISYIKSKISVTEEDIATILTYFKPMKVKKNEMLLNHGQSSQRSFFVVKGCLRIFFINEAATDYLLIGNVTSLAYLYELNRAIAVSKNVHSLVFANDAKEIFQDIDHSFPLDSYILDFKNPAELTKLLNENLPELSKNNVAYIAGDATEVALIHNFLKSNSKFSMDKIHYKNFRTEEK
ncbi:hypothetical protein [Soonwooa sp.]|uniref:hypothetical protein n=1 Tax=Soonwooa sp. TaxID=1938592 RepID=UPI002614213D|nr:hypothetical protein [Soonwooa sp.]